MQSCLQIGQSVRVNPQAITNWPTIALLAVTGVLLAGCKIGDILDAIEESKASSTPLGESRWEISCFESRRNCTDEASRLCRYGYDVQHRVINLFSEYDYTIVVQCRKLIDLDVHEGFK